MLSKDPTIAICICTFRRQPALSRLLQAISRLELDGLEPARVRVVLVDNDPTGSAEPVARRFERSLPGGLGYWIERRRGTPFARNAAVREAGPVDLVAFIDDDEYPEPRWLAELVRVQRSTGAAIVTGPVLPVVPPAAPAWARSGRFYERPRHRTGQRIDYARTSNVLIAARVFEGDAEPFSTRYVRGGEDTQFFLRALGAGHAIVWADEARVLEPVAEDRLRVRWLLRRAHLRGLILSWCLRELAWSRPRVLKRVAHGTARVARGSVYVMGGLLGRPLLAVEGLREIAFGLGLLHGLAQDRADLAT
jgi:succinoglycan biosynthesis protein ExoM